MPSWPYGMIHDFLGWIIKYQNGDWSSLQNCFGYFGLHHVFHFFNYSIFRIFGTNHVAWYIVFAVLSGVNATLLYRLLLKIFQGFGIQKFRTIAFLSSLLFLIGPYQVEVVTWKACLHYIMTVMFFTSILHLVYEFMIRKAKAKYLIGHHLLFIASLFTLEINLATPFILLVFAFMFSMKDEWNWSFYLKKFFLPHLVILAMYFLANKLILGEVVGHYGSDLHLNFDPSLLFSNGMSYYIKYMGLVHFWSFDARLSVYESMKTLSVMGGAVLFILSLIIWSYRKYRNDVHMMLSVGYLVSFFMALFPIANLYLMYIVPFQNDRYGYFASIFFYPFIFLLLFKLPAVLRYILLTIFLVANIYFSYKTVWKCREAGLISASLIESYKWYEDKEVRLVTIPDNYKGVYLFADFHKESSETWNEALKIYGKQEVKGNIIEYSHFLQSSAIDSFKYRIDHDTLHVEFKQYGNWFIRNGIGFTDFENDEIKASRKYNILRVELKDTTDRTYIIPQAGIWEKVDFR